MIMVAYCSTVNVEGEGDPIKKITKIIRIDADKCTGCRTCEAICSAFHAESQYSIVNPDRSRIRVFRDEPNDLYVPILAGSYTDVECNGHTATIIKGKEYGDCSFCRQSCPFRDLFKEPDSGLPLKCDMCGEPMPELPMCVKWCISDALVYIEREEDEETGEVTERVIEKKLGQARRLKQGGPSSSEGA